ncbi:MAG: electron transfer flavoprotein subunit beta/FixA family protein [Saprospiraceae bacterium]|nr:electron transfer flavoprotein subunit beta/FixA family protein [Saprospiraceae bacterium]
MKILVCLSKTADTTARIAFDAAGVKFSEEGVQFILNPYDEWYALVRAIELRDAQGGQVDVVHVGSAASDMLIRKALAIGADAAFRIDDPEPDTRSVAEQIARFAASRGYDLIFTGKETIDYNSSEVGAMLAAALNLPFVSLCSKLDFSDGTLRCTTDIEGGTQMVELRPPAVLSAAKGLAEQRIPNMKGIIDAKKKPLEVLPAEAGSALVTVVRYELPQEKMGVKMIAPDDVQELVNVFKNDLKLI